MGPERKRRMFDLLVQIGFKEIEVGFPAASQTDFDFVRQLIDESRIPDDVTIQVLTQARDDLIRRTFEAHLAARGAPSCTSTTRPRRCSAGSCSASTAAGIVDIAVTGARAHPRAAERNAGDRGRLRVLAGELHRHRARLRDGDLRGGDGRLAADAARRKIILNLPATVEMATPNVYADQIEWFGRTSSDRDSIVLVRPSAQRPRHRRRRGRARRHGRRRPRRRHALRQRRAHRQRRHRDPGAESLHPGRRSGLDISDIDDDRRDRRVLQPAAGAPAPPLRRRAGVHRLFRLASGRDQERASPRSKTATRRLGSAVPARSTRAISAAATRRSSASTASRARAASPTARGGLRASSAAAPRRSSSARWSRSHRPHRQGDDLRESGPQFKREYLDEAGSASSTIPAADAPRAAPRGARSAWRAGPGARGGHRPDRRLRRCAGAQASPQIEVLDYMSTRWRRRRRDRGRLRGSPGRRRPHALRRRHGPEHRHRVAARGRQRSEPADAARVRRRRGLTA